MFMPSARASRNTFGESTSAMVSTSTGIEEPNTPSTISARISGGIERITSTSRDSATSTQPPSVAAARPTAIPMKADTIVVAAAMPIVVRAP